MDGVLKETTKNDRSLRWVALWRPAVDDLDAYLATRGGEPDALIFGDVLGAPWTAALKRNWDRRVIGTRTPPGFVTYDLRHSHVSLLVRGGWDIVRIAKRMGHSPQSTVSTYAHALDEYDGSGAVDPEKLVLKARGRA